MKLANRRTRIQLHAPLAILCNYAIRWGIAPVRQKGHEKMSNINF